MGFPLESKTTIITNTPSTSTTSSSRFFPPPPKSPSRGLPTKSRSSSSITGGMMSAIHPTNASPRSSPRRSISMITRFLSSTSNGSSGIVSDYNVNNAKGNVKQQKKQALKSIIDEALGRLHDIDAVPSTDYDDVDNSSNTMAQLRSSASSPSGGVSPPKTRRLFRSPTPIDLDASIDGIEFDPITTNNNNNNNNNNTTANTTNNTNTNTNTNTNNINKIHSSKQVKTTLSSKTKTKKTKKDTKDKMKKGTRKMTSRTKTSAGLDGFDVPSMSPASKKSNSSSTGGVDQYNEPWSSTLPLPFSQEHEQQRKKNNKSKQHRHHGSNKRRVHFDVDENDVIRVTVHLLDPLTCVDKRRMFSTIDEIRQCKDEAKESASRFATKYPNCIKRIETNFYSGMKNGACDQRSGGGYIVKAGGRIKAVEDPSSSSSSGNNDKDDQVLQGLLEHDAIRMICESGKGQEHGYADDECVRGLELRMSKILTRHQRYVTRTIVDRYWMLKMDADNQKKIGESSGNDDGVDLVVRSRCSLVNKCTRDLAIKFAQRDEIEARKIYASCSSDHEQDSETVPVLHEENEQEDSEEEEEDVSADDVTDYWDEDDNNDEEYVAGPIMI